MKPARALGRAGWLPYVTLGVLTGMTVYPWFRNQGMLFLLDFVWPPTLSLPADFGHRNIIGGLPLDWLWWTLSRLVPTDFVQKSAFALLSLLAGISSFQLTRHLTRTAPFFSSLIAALAAGIFYAWNPFVFTRTLMGQYYLLLAYAITPWTLLAFERLFLAPSRARALLAGLAAATPMLINAHHLVLIPLLLALWSVGRNVRTTPKRFWALVLFFPFLVVASTGGLWLATHGASAGAAFDHPLGPWARALRAPFSGNLLTDALALTANWKTALRYDFPYETLPGFGFLVLGILAVMLVGGLTRQPEYAPRRLRRRLAILLLVGVFLAVGVAHPLTAPLAGALYRHVPLWTGLRDSGKFLALVALAESLLLGLGTVALTRLPLSWGGGRTRAAIAALPLLVVLALSTPAWHAFGRQVLPHAYPESWYAWNAMLADLPGRARLLFLPWHGYLPFSFTENHTVVNPAVAFFSYADVIAGDTSEVGGSDGAPFIYSESRRPISQVIQELLTGEGARSAVGAQLAQLGFHYVVLARDTPDAAQYGFLFQQPDLTVTFERDDLVVWRTPLARDR